MEQKFESAQTKIEKPEEREPEKDGYQAAVEAVDALADLLKKETFLEEEKRQMKDMENTIWKGMIGLNHEEEYDFFETIPSYLKLNELPIGREAGIDIKLLSDRAHQLLIDGLKGLLSGRIKLPELDRKKVDYLFQALLNIYQANDYSAAAMVHDFLEKYKDNLEEHKEYAKMTAFLESDQAKYHFENLIYNELHKNKMFLDWKPRAKASVMTKMGGYGLDKKSAENILNSWFTEEHPHLRYIFNLMDDMENRYHGMIKFLYEKFGIRNFHRYPLDLLSDQLENFEDKERPYGIIINPTSDWNGAFSEIIFPWYRLYRQTKDFGYNLRVVECDSKFEVARRLIGLDRKYGDRHKISFAFIGGHGKESLIKFGGDKPVNTLYIGDLMGKGVKRSLKFFEKNPRIVLISCSTGADKGIGRKLSEVLGAKVIAPDKPTNIQDIGVYRTRDILNFNIEYTNKESKKTFAKGRKR